ncbi:CoA-substrate-specific enzyme activase domain- containing protein [Thermocrinis albus DSM 14484]|uniref:CoA-substrate-specific enzyme activase domain-containing protein n=1 Tax=Thermocrinis albus (strain DSM 14484 / JCM 11386 / HI 11/12) TaxID=638303 RepID=D3SNX2_THEAH|nr:CoA-substrate-specific enzyme activase domain- containing protein [Thermocrinis albus DSM 14484]
MLKRRPSGTERKSREWVKVGIPRFLNVWGTAPFWTAFFQSLGVGKVVFSSETSEEQYRTYGKGRVTMDSCYPVKALAGHIGELLHKDINLLVVPMIYSLPSFLKGYVQDTLSCTRVMMAPENIKAGFLREGDEFAKRGIRYVSPFVPFGEPELLPLYLYRALRSAIEDITMEEVKLAVEEGFKALREFDRKARELSLKIIRWCTTNNRPAVLILARPYHMDPGIGHEIDAEFQLLGYPVLWYNYLPLEDWLLNWLFGKDVEEGRIRHPLDISDVWTSSYSSNTNEIIWGAKFGSRLPWITAVIRLSSYECGMDQPTFTPVQRIVESSGTMFFKFGELDETKPSGSVRIRVETIAYYLQQYSQKIIEAKLKRLPPVPHQLVVY